MKLYFLLFLFLLLPLAYGQEVIDGSAVFDEEQYRFNITPAVRSGADWVYLGLLSKNYTGDVNVVVGVVGDYVSFSKLEYFNPHWEQKVVSYTCKHDFYYTLNPNYFYCYVSNESGTEILFEHYFEGGDVEEATAWWYELESVDYSVPFNAEYGKVNVNAFGMDTWYYVKNVYLVAGVERRARVWLDMPYLKVGESQYWDSKYDVCFYPGAYGVDIRSAIQADKFFCIDPWTEGTTGLTAYYDMDTNGVLEDVHTGVFNGSLHGATYSGSGVLGGSYYCDGGNDYIVYWTDDNDLIGDTGDFSVSYWVNAGATTDSDYGRIIDNYFPDAGGDNDYFNSFQSTVANQWYASVRDDGNDANNPISNGVSVGSWVHHVLVYLPDEAILRQYINGDNVANISLSLGDKDITDGEDMVSCAEKYNGGIQRYWRGYLDEVAFFARALSHDEVAYLFENPGYSSIAEEEPEPPADTCDNCDGSGDCYWDCSDECNVSSPIIMNGYSIVINQSVPGNFSIVLGSDVSGFGRVSIAGFDSDNKCTVVCLGGCFKD